MGARAHGRPRLSRRTGADGAQFRRRLAAHRRSGRPWTTDGYLSLTGRIKNLINRGGEKVSPEHVEDILAGCPGVAEAAVFAVPDAVYGQRVGAAVAVREGETVGPEEILRYCRDRLAAFEVPDRLELVAALPHTAKGGLDRHAVEARYAR